MKHYDVILSGTAESDIREIIRYIAVALREPATAEKMLDQFDDAIRSLVSMPERNPPVSDPDLAAMAIRLQLVGNYILFYTVDKNAHKVNIVRVQHGKRDWIKILTESCL